MVSRQGGRAIPCAGDQKKVGKAKKKRMKEMAKHRLVLMSLQSGRIRPRPSKKPVTWKNLTVSTIFYTDAEIKEAIEKKVNRCP